MGNLHDNNSIHQHHRRKTIFLTILCWFSIRGIKTSHHRKDPKLAAAGEPSSPQVSCMGKVKRSKRIIGLPAVKPPTGITNQHQRSYSFLRRLLSSAMVLPPSSSSVPVIGGVRTGSKSCRSSREMWQRNPGSSRRKNDGDKCEQDRNVVVLNIAELDPPLPVVKRAAEQPLVVNLWKRRLNAAALKSLQIQPIHSRITGSQPETV